MLVPVLPQPATGEISYDIRSIIFYKRYSLHILLLIMSSGGFDFVSKNLRETYYITIIGGQNKGPNKGDATTSRTP